MHVTSNTISSLGNLCVKNQSFEKIKASGSCNLDNITCTGLLVCSGSAQIKNSHLGTIKVSGAIDLRNSTAENVAASGNFYALDCLKLRNINTSGHASFVNCENVNEIVASGSLSLLTTQVDGNVIHSGKDLHINDTKIAGRLECVDSVKVNNSFINELIIKRDKSSSYSFEFFGIFKFSKQSPNAHEPVVELIGKNCIVNSISFEEGCSGKVILKDGANVSGTILRGVLVRA